MKLPIAFQEKMKHLLGEEYTDYLATYSQPKYQGIRINTMKVDGEKWETINPFHNLEPVEWCKEGFYYEDAHPAKHPYYFAGLYYMQEPSAMAPGAYIPIEEGDKVLDLCAAPGGKSTQVLAKLNQTGLLVANDISATRAKALLKNIENFGVRNAMITNETSDRLAAKCPGFFNKILIDAPCSGEGMFRKSEEAIKNWETYDPEYCMGLQRVILEDAHKMLQENGMILYSTCTFSPEENEGMIQEFLTNHPQYKVVQLEGVGGIGQGKPEWVEADQSLKGALRLWPHHLKGEGHFVCLLQKLEHEVDQTERLKVKQCIKDFEPLKAFIQMNTTINIDTPVVEIKGKIYAVGEDVPAFSGLRIVRSGLLLGEIKNKRFEPSHAMVLAYPREVFKNFVDLSSQDEQVRKYLKGETLLIDVPKGYHTIGVDGYPLGWAKSNNGMLKNQYPPNWRMMG